MSSNAQFLQQHSTFLTALPAEIRNAICERLLVHRSAIKILRGQSERRARLILDVCHQLKAEFSGLYYHSNTFTCQCTDSDLERQLSSTDSIVDWLKRIGPRNRSVLREIQMRLLTIRVVPKEFFLGFLRDQNSRLSREVGWLPLNIVKIVFDDHWLDQLELSEIIVEEACAEEIETLDRTGNIERKGPDLRVWKRDLYDPVIDKSIEPGQRLLSEFVCPATWRYHARSKAESTSDELSVSPPVKEDESGGCLSGGLKVLVAKVRKSKHVFSRSRKKRVPSVA